MAAIVTSCAYPFQRFVTLYCAPEAGNKVLQKRTHAGCRGASNPIASHHQSTTRVAYETRRSEMGIFKGAMVVAALAFAAPVWAHGGHGHDRGWDRDRGHHYGWDRDNHGRDWRHHGHHYRD